MLDDLKIILQEICQLDQKSPLVVGVSGGPDSLFLFEILHKAGYQPIAVYINHGLRQEAVEESKIVKRVAEGKGLEFYSFEEDVRGLALREHLSIEEAARLVRYNCLFRLAEERHAQAVAVGHTGDDQVETVMMHLLRGTGLSGLRGMPYRSLPNTWSANIPLVRPLLKLWREDIDGFLKAWQIYPVTDKSNLDKTFFRNRLRHDLIPHLQKYNPSIREAILRMSDILTGDDEVVEHALETAWSEVLVHQSEGIVQISTDVFRRQLVGMQRRILRRAISRIQPALRDIDYEGIGRGISFLRAQRFGKVDLGAGITLLAEGESTFITSPDADLPVPDLPQVRSISGQKLDVPGVCDLAGNWRITAEWAVLDQSVRDEITGLSNPYTAWLDAGNLVLPLQVRGRLPGDSLPPFGMKGHQVKLSDLMVNLKIPQRLRARWPLVLCGGDIVWVPGYRIREGCQVGDSSTMAVKLELKHLD